MPENFARFRWLAVLALLIVLAYLVPYTLLTDVELITGAFAFWTGFGILSVGLIVFVVSRWKVQE